MNRPHLGMVDWGIGGLDLRRRLAGALAGLPITYWSDTGVTPYGQMPAEELARRLRTVVAELSDRGCSEVVVACNAASTVLNRLGRTEIPVSGVVEAGVAVVDEDARFVGVVGGQRTIRSGQYRRRLARPGRVVRSRVAQPLSAHIEAGRVSGPAFEADLARIVAPLRGADVVVLACTHYPAARAAFEAALPATTLVDPVVGLARSLVRRLGPLCGVSEVPTARPIVTTGDPSALVEAAKEAWGMVVDPSSVTTV